MQKTLPPLAKLPYYGRMAVVQLQVSVTWTGQFQQNKGPGLRQAPGLYWAAPYEAVAAVLL